MKIYAGIGSRNTPDETLELMTQMAQELSMDGWTLRSGAADGADTAFSEGAIDKEIYLPWNGFNMQSEGVVLDSIHAWNEVSHKYHPAPEKCTIGAQRLHGRNAFIVLGELLQTPADMVVCWTPGGKVEGGTGLAIRIAEGYGIPVFNLAVSSHIDKLVSFVNDYGKE